MTDYKRYQRTAIAEVADWTPEIDMTGVSISDADRLAGSPKPGDKIARNPKNHADRWLIAADYFAENFAAAPPQKAEPREEWAAIPGTNVRIPVRPLSKRKETP